MTHMDQTKHALNKHAITPDLSIRKHTDSQIDRVMSAEESYIYIDRYIDMYVQRKHQQKPQREKGVVWRML
jgi:hypothetical protein